MSEGLNVSMSESGDAVPGGGRLGILMSVMGVLEGLPRVFVPGQVILFPLLLGSAVGMRGAVVQFGGSLVVLVM